MTHSACGQPLRLEWLSVIILLKESYLQTFYCVFFLFHNCRGDLDSETNTQANYMYTLVGCMSPVTPTNRFQFAIVV